MIIKRVTISPGGGWGLTKTGLIDGKPGSIETDPGFIDGAGVIIEGWGEI